ncbi:hypothetical protein [Leifsonia aquatica]|uniref:hypothetical protein n=1 Tax=Leifsonia aquatica TaxID=144185 RepID=UPI000B1C93ED|nr:hypothetical protein [Leifsonia aquatica]
MPNPLGRDLWPEFTTTSIDDVTVAGVSLTRLAEWCNTPSVHTAAAVIPGTGGMPSPTETTSVIVTRVIEINTAADGAIDIWIDARLTESNAVICELRLIGRVSTASDACARIHPVGESVGSLAVPEVVSDLRVGDLLAIPCQGTTRLREVDPARRHVPDDDERSWSATTCRR